MVDRMGTCAHQNYLADFISFLISPRQVKNEELKRKYLTSTLSAQQLAEEFGVSKQMILGRLRQAGVHGGKGRGRSSENYRFPNPPFGYRVVNGRLEVHTPELKVVRLIVELRDRKQMTFVEIANELNRRGHGTRRGCKWTKVVVRTVHSKWKNKV